MLENFFKRKSQEPKVGPKILPSDVRYALQYKEAILGKSEIEDLNLNHFENEALYLTVKGLQDKPEEQKKLIENYVSFVLGKTNEKNKDSEILRNLINESLEKNNSFSVQGEKLAQISRQGFDVWQERFKNKAEELSNDKRDVFLVANAMVLGLGKFIENFSKTKKDLNIIIPKWIDNESELIGYSIKFKDGKANIEYLQKNYIKDQDVTVLVDDATNSGQVFAKIKEYWRKNGSKEPDTIAISTTK